jgi:hypothetical protein
VCVKLKHTKRDCEADECKQVAVYLNRQQRSSGPITPLHRYIYWVSVHFSSFSSVRLAEPMALIWANGPIQHFLLYLGLQIYSRRFR